MKRRLIVGERVMYANGGSSVNCTFTVAISGALQLHAIEAALAKLQTKHPLLRALIEEDEKGMPWFVIGDEAPAIPVRIKERQSEEDWIAETTRQFPTSFALQQAPLARLVWIKSDTVSELMIVLPHCICDGTTIINLMQELLENLENPDNKVEPYTTFTSVQELIPVESLPDTKAIKKAKAFSKLATVLLTLKTMGGKVTPNKNYMLRWQLDKEQSNQVVDWCKTKGINIHAAVGLAFLRAFRRVKGTQAKNKLICPVDIRRYVKGIRTDTMFAFAPIVELSPDKQKEADFPDQAKAMKEDLQKKVLALNGCEMLAASEYFHPAVKKMVKLLKTARGSHDITFSNVGIIPLRARYSTFEVVNAYSPNAAFPWRNPNTLVISSFAGRIDFTFLSEEGFLPYEQAAAIKDAAMTELYHYSKEGVVLHEV